MLDVNSSVTPPLACEAVLANVPASMVVILQAADRLHRVVHHAHCFRPVAQLHPTVVPHVERDQDLISAVCFRGRLPRFALSKWALPP
jgi:hypothetical protein